MVVSYRDLILLNVVRAEWLNTFSLSPVPPPSPLSPSVPLSISLSLSPPRSPLPLSPNFAVHNAYRSSLRPLKLKHPLLNVVRASWLNMVHGNMLWEPQGQGAWRQGLGGVASARPGLNVLEALLGASSPSPSVPFSRTLFRGP